MLRNILKDRGFIMPAYHIYGGREGYHDLGPNGIKMKHNLLKLWRQIFVNTDEWVEEIECPIITPSELLKASGHLEKFTDYIVSDREGKSYRADHLLEDFFRTKNKELVSSVASMSKEELEDKINDLNVLNVDYEVEVHEKNLMFPAGTNFYLRPELAQGIFINAKRYQQLYRKGNVFGLAQIGNSYRQEISPKPFLRMREFCQAEIEFFYDPESPLEIELPHDSIPLLIDDTITWKYANEIDDISPILLYFMCKAFDFCIKIGLNIKKIRFRRHDKNEMAHYARDCWDLECLVEGKWIECIGCADRGDFDMRCQDQKFSRTLDDPKIVEYHLPAINKKEIAKHHKKDTMKIIEALNQISEVKLLSILEEISEKGNAYIVVDTNPFEIDGNMLDKQHCRKKIIMEEYYPCVIEPSFGLDRLLYALYEHTFYVRSAESTFHVFQFNQEMAPYHIAVLQLSKNADLIKKANEIIKYLRSKGATVYVDQASVSIGKLYARLDEIGVKYAVTVDFETLKDNTFTIRDRDSKEQYRVEFTEKEMESKVLPILF